MTTCLIRIPLMSVGGSMVLMGTGNHQSMRPNRTATRSAVRCCPGLGLLSPSNNNGIKWLADTKYINLPAGGERTGAGTVSGSEPGPRSMAAAAPDASALATGPTESEIVLTSC